MAYCTKDMPTIMLTMLPAMEIVFGVVCTRDMSSSSSHILPKRLKVSTEVYLDVLKKIVEPCIKETIRERLFVLQQDSAPFHTSRNFRCCLRPLLLHHLT